MKKIVALLTCLSLGAACLTGCTRNEAFTEKSYTAEGEEITEISIDVRDRQIEVTLSPDNQVHIEYFESSKEYYEISVSDNYALTMTAVSDKEWTDYIGGKSAASSRKISLQVPDALLTALEISTTNEDISLPALTVNGDVSLSSVGGNIDFDKLNVESTISLTAKNGNITGSILGSYDDYTISCDSKKGESNLPSSKEGGAKTLTVSNNNGGIDIEFASIVCKKGDSATTYLPDEQEIIENIVDYSSFFGDVTGSAVFYNPNDNTIDVYQKEIANEPHSPCSSFKIISSLIGMECEAIGYESNTRKWSGEKFWNNVWNTDISFINAFQSSCVWYFREVTNEIGKENTQKFLDELNYGNTDISDWQGKRNKNNSNPALTGFWIESSLLITPIEQTKVLAQIFEPSSIYSQQSLDLLTTAMLVQESDKIKIYGKTGTGKLGNTLLDAWFVGFFTQNNENVYFAIYLSETDDQEISSSTAKEIGLDIISNVY